MDYCASTGRWRLGTRIVFRFTCCYVFLFVFPFPLQHIAFFATSKWCEALVTPVHFSLTGYEDLWNELVPWVGARAFRTEITIRPNGSGDTTYNYVQVFSYAVITLLVTTAWSLLDWRRPGYPRLYAWLRIYVRFYLLTMMISYGSVKVIKSQFPNPSFDRLLEPFGSASPMGLLWAFMGASVSYNAFTGAGELLGGLLLATRRTTLLGALLSMVVLSNIVMLNFSYDVPVKILSVHLLAMTIFLAAPDLKQLVCFFLLGRNAQAVDTRPLCERAWAHRMALVLRTLFVVAITYEMLHGAQESRKAWGDLQPRSPLYGIWTTEEFAVDGKDVPPLYTDKARWRRIVFDGPWDVFIHLADGRRLYYLLALDEDKHAMVFSTFGNPNKWELSYDRLEPDLLLLTGTLENRSIRTKVRRKVTDLRAFPLLNRGFHWINEYPFNQ